MVKIAYSLREVREIIVRAIQEVGGARRAARCSDLVDMLFKMSFAVTSTTAGNEEALAVLEMTASESAAIISLE